MVQYPYGIGKTFSLETPLAVARTALCIRATQSLVIDGFLSEVMWSDPVARFFRSDGTATDIDSTFFYFAYDRDHLYLGARCVESHMESLFAVANEHDGAVYSEDCVGYFFQPDAEEGSVYQIYFSALGTIFDQAFSADANGDFEVNRRWDVSCDILARQGENAWTIESAIPMTQFEVSNAAGHVWRLNFRRKQWRLGETADWQLPIGHNPATLEFLEFQ